jgi:hypothetical protein
MLPSTHIGLTQRQPQPDRQEAGSMALQRSFPILWEGVKKDLTKVPQLSILRLNS